MKIVADNTYLCYPHLTEELHNKFYFIFCIFFKTSFYRDNRLNRQQPPLRFLWKNRTNTTVPTIGVPE